MYTEFIEVNTDCIVACEQCVQACLSEGKALNCCKICLDCANLGTLATKMISSKSPFADDILMLYAEACDACAAECEKHALYYHHCKVCAEACRDCSRNCRDLILQIRD